MYASNSLRPTPPPDPTYTPHLAHLFTPGHPNRVPEKARPERRLDSEDAAFLASFLRKKKTLLPCFLCSPPRIRQVPRQEPHFS